MAVVKFAVEHGERLLRQFVYEVSRCIKSPDAEAVHDLRVSVRRFSQALIVCCPLASDRR